jgi:Na+-transporting methylmalonyl-CoA/oxaloacetate decarboxylase gamma subunit
MVLLLLICFVFVMKLMGSIMARINKAPAAVTAQPAAQPQREAAAAPTEAADDMAAVAYALHLYFNSLHDVEQPRLTFSAHASSWHPIH